MSRPMPVRWPLPGTWTIRSGMPSTSTGSVISNGPTTNATRYVLIGIVSPNRTATRPSPASSRAISGPLETAVSVGSITSVMPNTALKSGSSQQGKARRQSVACICVVAMTCSVPVVVLERRAVPAPQLVVEDPGVGDDERDGARLQPADRHDEQPLGHLVEAVAGVAAVDGDLEHVELDGVEHQLVDRLGQFDLDRHPTLEGRRVEIWRQLHVVAPWDGRSGETVRVERWRVSGHAARWYPALPGGSGRVRPR